ncbi:MAG: hypothetical protein RLQ25_11860 [Alphaproteobacteria bacterium]
MTMDLKTVSIITFGAALFAISDYQVREAQADFYDRSIGQAGHIGVSPAYVGSTSGPTVCLETGGTQKAPPGELVQLHSEIYGWRLFPTSRL